MTWRLSQFRARDLVEVRSREEILRTLDERGCLDGMPVMPEMLQYCGRQFRVSAVAHKTCDTARQTWTGRRLQLTVHLASVRCDGHAHGNCQAECNIFWKDAWLKPAVNMTSGVAMPARGTSSRRAAGCTEAQLVENTRLPAGTDGSEQPYSCQATQMYAATEALAAWDPRQYVYDVITRNCSARRVLRVLCLSWFRWVTDRMPRGRRLAGFANEAMHCW